MATQNANKVSSAATLAMPGVGDGQGLKCVAGTYTSTVAPPLNEVIQSPQIPLGSIITDVVVIQSGMGASGAFSVGYGASTAYHSAAASGVTAGVRRMDAANIPLVLAATDTVDVTVTAAGATAAVTFTIIVYFMPINS